MAVSTRLVIVHVNSQRRLVNFNALFFSSAGVCAGGGQGGTVTLNIYHLPEVQPLYSFFKPYSVDQLELCQTPSCQDLADKIIYSHICL